MAAPSCSLCLSLAALPLPPNCAHALPCTIWHFTSRLSRPLPHACRCCCAPTLCSSSAWVRPTRQPPSRCSSTSQQCQSPATHRVASRWARWGQLVAHPLDIPLTCSLAWGHSHSGVLLLLLLALLLLVLLQTQPHLRAIPLSSPHHHLLALPLQLRCEGGSTTKGGQWRGSRQWGVARDGEGDVQGNGCVIGGVCLWVCRESLRSHDCLVALSA